MKATEPGLTYKVVTETIGTRGHGGSRRYRWAIVERLSGMAIATGHARTQAEARRAGVARKHELFPETKAWDENLASLKPKNKRGAQ